MTESKLKLTFRDCEPSQYAERSVRDHFAKLLELGVDIDSAHAVLSIPHQHHTKGNHHCVHLQLNLPGKTLVADHEKSGDDRRNEDMYLSIADTFARARRMLLEFKDRRRDHHANSV